MGRTLELFELESNPAGEIKCNHVKGTVVSPGPGRNYPKVLTRELTGGDRLSTVTNTTTPIMMIHWGEIIHEIP